MNTNQWRRQNNAPEYIDYERELHAFDDKGNSSVDMRVTFCVEEGTAYVTLAVHNDSGKTVDMADMTNTGEVNITWEEGERLIGMKVEKPSRPSTGSHITWTRPKLERFKKDYADAVSRAAEEFTFEGHPFLVSYSKYLIEFLEGRLA